MQQAAPAPITRQKVYLVVALFALALAASTGVLIRFGLVSGFPISAVFWLRLAAWTSLAPAAVATVAFLLAALGPVRGGTDSTTSAQRRTNTAQASE